MHTLRTTFSTVCFALGFATSVSAMAAQAGSAQQVLFQSDGLIPNSRLPVLIYRNVPLDGDKAAAFEQLFTRNGWPAQWRAGIFDYHHYHSNAHEVLGVASGTARITLGGEHGEHFDIGPGDVLVLPAGTGHRRIEQSSDFMVVGAYPRGQESYDIQRADRTTLAAAQARIAQVPMPEADPVTGRQGVLMSVWARL
jgi:uncharacterized protein YjlB